MENGNSKYTVNLIFIVNLKRDINVMQQTYTKLKMPNNLINCNYPNSFEAKSMSNSAP